MRLPLSPAAALISVCVLGGALGGCASTAVSSCQTIAGSGWSVLSAPPPNALQLLGMQGVADAGRLIWLGKGSDKVLACRYESGLIYPGCSASLGYVFEKKHAGWVTDGVVMDACDANGVSDD